MTTDSTNRTAAAGVLNAGAIDLEDLHRNGKVFKENASASVLDLGDRIGLVEFHTKANALDDDACAMIVAACEEGQARFDALVIGNRGRHFSAGANLTWLLSATSDGKWADIERTIRALQGANMTLKYGPLPVVAAPFSSALGGGCEVCLHSARVVAAEATHMGLVETGVGLVPSGGGTTELGLRAQTRAAAQGTDPLAALHQPFDLITAARVSASGAEAQQLFLTPADMVAPGQVGAIDQAKQVALGLVRSGYRNGDARTDLSVLGSKGLSAFQAEIDQRRAANLITEHDAVIATHVATILCGGDQPAGTASEQHFLDLEREAFLSLLGTPQTQERIAYLLKENKRLHN
jgi:3-hydroxyacyl-CoA dehydrogenase